MSTGKIIKSVYGTGRVLKINTEYIQTSDRLVIQITDIKGKVVWDIVIDGRELLAALKEIVPDAEPEPVVPVADPLSHDEIEKHVVMGLAAYLNLRTADRMNAYLATTK